MARLEPQGGEISDPFWEATRARKFLVQWCGACAAPIFYPREVCPQCLSADSLEWHESSGQATVYAASVQHRPANPTMADKVPYVVALVEVDAGNASGNAGQTIRVMSNVVNCDPLSVQVGDAVALTWEELSDGRHLPLFEPTK